jgi:hypothetical protein
MLRHRGGLAALGKGRGRRLTRLLVAAALLLGGAERAGAAEFSDCCADLEERIAELEATTARKGNRNVAVVISGTINQSALAWYDGKASSVYTVTNDNYRSRFGFGTEFRASAEWQLGYHLEIGIKDANSLRVNQLSPLGFDNKGDFGTDIRDNYWYLLGKRFGALFIGSTFAATDRIADSNVTQTNFFAKYSEIQDTGFGMFLRSSRSGQLTQSDLTWRRLIAAGGDQPSESQRGFELIKYATPKWNGWNAIGTWVADDFWDVATRYDGTVGRFNISAGIGYTQLVPGARSRVICAGANVLVDNGDDTSCRQLSGSISVLDRPTGLFVNFGSGLNLNGLIKDTLRYRGTGVSDQHTFASGQAGIERQFNELGKTTIYGEHFVYDGGAATAVLVGPGDSLNPTGAGSWAVWNSRASVWGGGIAQGIDSAAMILYLYYRHASGELNLRQLNGFAATGPIAGAPIDDLDLLMSGAVIRF